ncbi:hypothetical protein [Cupriavidus basilensis]|uniref:Uncharacterized protein n=1 Tax=Cupriavidus basilensis TaxID=68895 RepID=A0A643FM23_9BURK|nr:hypothetical protein [Cupriavidus basilensis]MCP3022734.1 hypothetical protein [Cupriavidus basilensis]MDR3381087.1 hypothetical protein [Cupriavidus basilensis]QOT80947.1 hypothetical protein F7R26_026475 [Cupriavidus basilensis]
MTRCYRTPVGGGQSHLVGHAGRRRRAARPLQSVADIVQDLHVQARGVLLEEFSQHANIG